MRLTVPTPTRERKLLGPLKVPYRRYLRYGSTIPEARPDCAEPPGHGTSRSCVRGSFANPAIPRSKRFFAARRVRVAGQLPGGDHAARPATAPTGRRPPITSPTTGHRRPDRVRPGTGEHPDRYAETPGHVTFRRNPTEERDTLRSPGPTLGTGSIGAAPPPLPC